MMRPGLFCCDGVICRGDIYASRVVCGCRELHGRDESLPYFFLRVVRLAAGRLAVGFLAGFGRGFTRTN